MKVITSNNVVFRNTPMSSWGVYSSLDGKSSQAEIKAFQDWLDINQPTWLNGSTLKKGKGYGTFGPSTTKAWKVYGSSYTKALGSVNTGGGGSTPILPVTASGTPANNPNLTTTSPKGEKKPGYVFDRALGGFVKLKDAGVLDLIGGLFGKNLPGSNANQNTGQTWDGGGQTPPPTTEEKPGMSKTTKILIGVGGVLVIGVIIYMLTKKSPTTKATK